MPKKDAPPPRPWTDDLEEDLQRLLSVGEECISEKELRSLLLARGRGCGDGADAAEPPGAPAPPVIRLYDGFEPSGRMHIAQGLLKAVNVNKCTFPGTRAVSRFSSFVEATLV